MNKDNCLDCKHLNSIASKCSYGMMPKRIPSQYSKPNWCPIDKEIINSENYLKMRGKRFNKGKLRWSLVDLKYLEGLVEVLMMGAEKYGDYNWQKGLPTLEVYESLMRHIVAWKNGSDKDEESGLDHIDHAICNLYFIKWMIKNKPNFDNRLNKPNEQIFEEYEYPDENEK